MYIVKLKSLEALEIHEEPVLSAGRLIGSHSEQVNIDYLLLHLKVTI